MKTYIFLTILLLSLCLGLALKPRSQSHNLVVGHLRETMSYNSLQEHVNQMVSPSMSNAGARSEYEQQTEHGDNALASSNGMNRQSVSHYLLNRDEPTSSQSYHQHEMQMRNRHHLMKGDVHDEYSVGDYGNYNDNNNDNENDNDDDDQLNDNRHHNQNDLDEPNNGERRYYVDDNDLKRKFKQEDTSSLNPRDYIDYNKEIKPQKPQHGPYPHDNNKLQRQSKSTSHPHDHEGSEYYYNAANQEAHHPSEMNHDKLEAQSLTTNLNQQSTEEDNHSPPSSAPSPHQDSENDYSKHKWRNAPQ